MYHRHPELLMGFFECAKPGVSDSVAIPPAFILDFFNPPKSNECVACVVTRIIRRAFASPEFHDSVIDVLDVWEFVALELGAGEEVVTNRPGASVKRVCLRLRVGHFNSTS
ncbi:hypothetical protein HFTV1-gp51 [Haloferax tailed virus 1]|uniref:Uncharacterized protein n=1 Tax=Haloferax tailed virus 1 TaxID=2507575 RepID=A0A410N6Y3_HFTV1|nr:hypothetical protein M1M17_gp51 [Haloferax tailed virus 1]QAS68884.1 hypothetical protein HFTV1-gp51 [Haloferax tailed virus 1]